VSDEILPGDLDPEDWAGGKEWVGSAAPGDATIGRNGGGATMEFACLPDELSDRISETLESVEQDPRGDGGGLMRTLPLAHPWPALRHFYASKMSNIRGHGVSEVVTEDEWLEAPGPSSYAQYQLIRYRCQFDPRPYAVLSDESIATEEIVWHDDAGTEHRTNCAQEWKRNTIIRKGDSTVEVITAQLGFMKLRMGGSTADDRQLQAQPALFIPKSSLIVTHVGLPLWWQTSPVANYDALVGRCNQKPIFDYTAGSLVLMKVAASEPYSPPQPSLEYEDTYGAVAQDKIIDVTMIFDIYVREPEATVTPTNKNDVCGPANAMPHIDGKFYYATSVVSPTDSAAAGRPRFRSGVMQFLFRSPIDG